MNAKVISSYLLGRRWAITEVAASTASFWTGLVLVLLTAIARNYDQTYVTEQWFLWLFGPLVFSLVSGLWVFLILNIALSRRVRGGAEGPEGSGREHWCQFMGLFWMTAPVAWLYALPVERFLGSLNAAKVNVGFLAIVSLWRVALMARVAQVIYRVPYWLGLSAVLVAACVEVVVLTLFGGTFARRLAASMGGMRNSPEEEILLGAINFACTHSLWIGLVALVGLGCRPALADPVAWPRRRLAPIPIRLLAALALGWVVIAVPAQLELARNVRVEKLVRAGEYRAALDYLGRHGPGDFAPSRVLPPKAFEPEVFRDLPGLISVLSPSDPAWVKGHCLLRLDEMITHFRSPWERKPWSERLRYEQAAELKRGIQGQMIGGREFGNILEGLARIPEGANWLRDHDVFLEALHQASREAVIKRYSGSKPEEEQRAEWDALLKWLEQFAAASKAEVSADNRAP